MKATRNNPVKEIGRAETVEAKYEVAIGKSITVKELKTAMDCAAIISRSHWLVESKPSAKVIAFHAEKIGAALVEAIVTKNHKAIHQLASQVQYGTKPRGGERLHKLIATFCLCHECGTKENPAPVKDLVTYLAHFGQRFSTSYDNEVPRSLNKTCEKMGIWIVNR